MLDIANAEAPELVEEISLPSVPEYKQYALKRVVEEWSLEEWEAFNKIVNKESSWEVTGHHNLSLSTAFGLGGFLDGTWSTVGCVKTYDKNTQIDCTVKYIKKRYNTPREALRWHIAHNWY